MTMCGMEYTIQRIQRELSHKRTGRSLEPSAEATVDSGLVFHPDALIWEGRGGKRGEG